MARRSDIDWEAIERDYRAGILTIREIAAKHSIHQSSVIEKAKSRSWSRDLSEAINNRAKAKIAAIDVEELIEQSAQQSAQQSEQTIRAAVEQASSMQAGVVVNHRKLISRNIEISNRIETKIAAMLDSVAEIKDVVALSGAHKSNVESKVKLITLERQAYNIDNDTVEGDKQPNLKVEFVRANN